MKNIKKHLEVTLHFALIIFLSILTVSSLLILGSCSDKKSKKGVDEAVPPVAVATPVTDSVVTHLTFPGVVKANNSVDVVARVDGNILGQYFKDGDMVSKGQVLFRIEATTYQNAVNEAEASLATARSKVEYYRNQYQAMQKALESDAVSKMNVIEAESNLRQSEAAVKNALASLSTARTQLQHCTVTAPISGQVSAANINVGDFVSGSGSGNLCSIVDNSSLKVTFAIDDTNFQLLQAQGLGKGGSLFKNVPLEISNAAGSSQIPGVTIDLYYVAPNINTSTGSITLEGKVNDPNKVLRDGQYVTVDLPTGVLPQATVIRAASVGTDQRGKYVYTVNDSNKVVYTSIVLGDTWQDSLVVVKSGLTPKDRYVTDALLTVRPGMEVKPVP